MNKSSIKTYNAAVYPIVLVTVDTALFTFTNDEWHVLLVKRNNEPFQHAWALPGGFIRQETEHNLEVTAKRCIQEKTGVSPAYLEQLQTLGSADRDPRGWSVTTAYTALIPYKKTHNSIESVKDAQWIPISKALKMNLAFDHLTIVKLAFERHRQKSLYSFIPVFGITHPFTITELRKAHEGFLNKSIQRKSFIRRVESSNQFKDTGSVRNERGRPASLYNVLPTISNYRFSRNLEE